MVRSRQLASAPSRTGAVRLTVTAVERAGISAEESPRLLALHGVHAGRTWRLTMAEALAALRTGRYVFEVDFQGERRRAELLEVDGAPRLVASSPLRGDLVDVLPPPGGQERGGPVASVARTNEACAAGSGPAPA